MTIGATNNSIRLVRFMLSAAIITLCVSCQYNPQQVGQTSTTEPDAIKLGGIQKPDTWSEYTLYSAFSLSVPNTMEKSNQNDRYSQQLNNIGTQRDNGIVIFQPKYLNNGSMANADEHYCRVLVNYEGVGANELMHSWETVELDAETRAQLFENVKANLTSAQQLLSWPTYEWVDIDGTKALRVKYRRSGNNENTTACAMYYLYNYDEIAFVMTAYREQEGELWQSDMEDVIRTFRWKRSK